MLNPFPIQFLSMVAFALLRIVIGFVFMVLGYRHFTHRHALALVFSSRWFPFGRLPAYALFVSELLIGLLYLLGLYTQYAALGALALALFMIVWRGRLPHHSLPGRLFYLLIFGASASLFITGAGIFAFDLPI